MTSDKPIVFISYASNDRSRVDALVDKIFSPNFDIWMDHRNIKAGQNWNVEIQVALRKSTVIIMFISLQSIDKRGYVQRELKDALDISKEKLSTDIFIIPVLLDELAERPRELAHLQMVDGRFGTAIAQIMDAINHQLDALGHTISQIEENSDIRWSEEKFVEKWLGLPGYSIEYNCFHLKSGTFQNINEIGKIVEGFLVSAASAERRAKLSQDPVIYNFGQQQSSRTHDFHAHCRGPDINNNVLSMTYYIHYYSPGAAHGMTGFKCFNFLLDPLIEISRMSDVFIDEKTSFDFVQQKVRETLYTELVGDEVENDQIYREWILNGTAELSDFASFSFSSEGIEFIFPQYQVASYADGPRFVTVSKWDIHQFLHPYLKAALGWEHVEWLERPSEPKSEPAQGDQ